VVKGGERMKEGKNLCKDFREKKDNSRKEKKIRRFFCEILIFYLSVFKNKYSICYWTAISLMFSLCFVLRYMCP